MNSGSPGLGVQSGGGSAAGAPDRGIPGGGFGWGESKPSVAEPVKGDFGRKATLKATEEEQSLRMRPEGNGNEREGKQRTGTREPRGMGVSRSRPWKRESGPAERVSGERPEGGCCVWPLGGHRHL